MSSPQAPRTLRPVLIGCQTENCLSFSLVGPIFQRNVRDHEFNIFRHSVLDAAVLIRDIVETLHSSAKAFTCVKHGLPSTAPIVTRCSVVPLPYNMSEEIHLSSSDVAQQLFLSKAKNALRMENNPAHRTELKPD